MRNALYVGSDIGSKNTAMAIHAQNVAKLFRLVGYNTYFLCRDNGDKLNRIYDGNYIYVDNYFNIPKISSLERKLDLITSFKLMKKVVKVVEEKNIECIIFYGIRGEKKLIDFCKRKKIKIYIDRVDWFEMSDRKQNLTNRITQYYCDKNILEYDFLSDGVISISKYFYDYYSKNKINTVWIPPIFDVENVEIKRKNHGKIKLVYAGSLGNNKDDIRPVVKGMIKRNYNHKNDFNLILIGISFDDLNKEFGNNNDWLKIGIEAKGKIPNQDVIKIVKDSDFSILLRQNKRYAKAGFSTKFAESMSYGTPVICTKVDGSDIVVTNKVDGFLIKNNEQETIDNILNIIAHLSSETIEQMKKSAYETAKKNFSIAEYQNKFKEFLIN